MSVYDINGNALDSVYSVSEDALDQCFDIDGNVVFESGPGFFDATVVTNKYTSSITSQPQGGCIDDDGNTYVCLYKSGFFRYNLVTGDTFQTSFSGEVYGHANGMTYNPNTEKLYLASMNSTGEVYVFDKSFNLVDTLYARNGNGDVFTCWNIAYDRNTHRFISLGSGVIYYFDDNFDLVDTGTYSVDDWPNTRQDIETDGTYIYCLSYQPNRIAVLDTTGRQVALIGNTAFSGEPESMMYDWVNDVYYIEGKSTYYVIRQVIFKE